MANFTVTTAFDIVDPVDSALSLREAIAMSQDIVDNIFFDPSVSLITLNPVLGPLTIQAGQNINIIGDIFLPGPDGGLPPDGRPDVFIDGGNATRLFTVLDGARLTLDTLFLQNGSDVGEVGLKGDDGTTGMLPLDGGSDGGPGGNGGFGFSAAGGIFNSGDLTLQRTTIFNSVATAGTGGEGGLGGRGVDGLGGVSGDSEFAIGQDGGNGGTGGQGGIGGDAGGAILNTGIGTVTLFNSGILLSSGTSGNGGDGGTGGSGGTGGMGADGLDGTFVGDDGAAGGDGGDGGTGGNGGGVGFAAGAILNFGNVTAAGTIAADLNTGTLGETGMGGTGGGLGAFGIGGFGGTGSITDGDPGPIGALGEIGSAGGVSGFSGEADDFIEDAFLATSDVTSQPGIVYLNATQTFVNESQPIRVDFQRIGNNQFDFTVDYAITPGPGFSSADLTGFEPLTGSVNFTSTNQVLSTETLIIDTLADGIEEGDETFTLSITGVSNPNVGIGTDSVDGIVFDQGNQPPVATDDFLFTSQFTPIFAFAPEANDFDLEGDFLFVNEPGLTAGGIALQNPDGSLAYAPRRDFVGVDTFEYIVDDGNGGTDTGTIEITVNALDERTVCARLIAYLYEAAFDRFPDLPGVNFWIDALNFELPGQTEVFTKEDIAEFFLTVPEFVDLFGPVDQLTDRELIELLFLNTLDRPGEQAGVDFWEGVLADPNFSRADMLLAFAESPENQLGSPAISTLSETGPSEWEFV